MTTLTYLKSYLMELKSEKELQLKYPKCFLPLHAMKTTKIIGFKNRPPLEEWWKNIKLNKN